MYQNYFNEKYFQNGSLRKFQSKQSNLINYSTKFNSKVGNIYSQRSYQQNQSSFRESQRNPLMQRLVKVKAEPEKSKKLVFYDQIKEIEQKQQVRTSIFDRNQQQKYSRGSVNCRIFKDSNDNNFRNSVFSSSNGIQPRSVSRQRQSLRDTVRKQIKVQNNRENNYNIDDIQQQIREKRSFLIQLQLNNRKFNQQVQQNQEFEKLKQQNEQMEMENNRLSAEISLLQEENIKKQQFNYNYIDNDFEKQRLVKDLQDQQQKTQQIQYKINNFHSIYQQKLNKYKNNCDNNLQMEYQNIDMQISNYDQEMKKWLRYFLSNNSKKIYQFNFCSKNQINSQGQYSIMS